MKSTQVGSACCAAAGLGGAIVCSISMFAVPLGIVGAGVAAGAKSTSSMSGMSDRAGTAKGAAVTGGAAHLRVWIELLNHYGPGILILSVLLIVAALALRRSIPGVVAALIGGIALYYGMYEQTNTIIMAAATIVGLLLLISSMFGLRRRDIAVSTNATHRRIGR